MTTTEKPKPKYVRLVLDRITAFCFRKNADHTKITISGFLDDRSKFKEGEYILLCSDTDPRECRYKITRTSFPMDVYDQFFIDLEFAPRITAEDFDHETC